LVTISLSCLVTLKNYCNCLNTSTSKWSLFWIIHTTQVPN
jgi:hypothetical protein